MVARCTYHQPTYFSKLLNIKKEPYKKAYLLTKNIEEFSGKSSKEWTSRQKKKDKTERVTGLGRRRSQDIVKWNQMTDLRFQTGGRHQTSPASLGGGEGDKQDTKSDLRQSAISAPASQLSNISYDLLYDDCTLFESS